MSRASRARRPVTPGPAAVLFDRDGTLVHDVPYNGDPALVDPVPTARPALARLRLAGIGVGVVSNQSGVARGLLTTAQVAAVNARLDALVGPIGVWAWCPHGEDDGCGCRKPAPGLVHRVVVDTAFFDGNHPTSARIETAWFEGHPSGDDVVAGPWAPVLGLDLSGDTATTASLQSPRAATHVRLRIHPDGGVARLRVLGEALPDVRRWRGLGVDLASLANGGRVLDASNRHYSAPENLLLPGSPATMGEGWETARRRDEGFEWVDVALGAAGTVAGVVVDTTHFLHNAPASVRLVTPDGAELLPETPLQPDTPHWFGPADGLDDELVVERVRVESRPDGGFARLRLWGRPSADAVAAAGLRRFHALPVAAAERTLLACCAATAWAAALVSVRPYSSVASLVAASTSTIMALPDAVVAEALAGHARIGAPSGGPGAREQAGVGSLSDADRDALAEGNRAYEDRFGHVYLVRAAGRSGAELLALLRERLSNDPGTEARVVREQLAEITALRIESLWTP